MSSTSADLFRQDTLGFDKGQVIDHVDLAESIIGETKGKSLAIKNSGKFYTPDSISRPLMAQAISALKLKTGSKVKIIDPFCGDGRLIVSILPLLKRFDVEIHLWDYDATAVKAAAKNVTNATASHNRKISVQSKKTDSFAEFFKGWESSFDIVITNPPWEVVKPDPKDLERISDSERRDKYISSLKEFSNRILRDYPLSRPMKAFGGWGVNLARVGTEVSIRLAKAKGVVAIVTPSTIFADQNSDKLRRWVFTENAIRNLNIYPAELKLFTGVDQPSVSFVLVRGGKQKSLNIANFDVLSKPICHRLNDLPALLKSTDYILPISVASNVNHLKILSDLNRLEMLSTLERHESIWLGRELDETNYQSWLCRTGRYSFLKGRNVDRFATLNESPMFVDEKLLSVDMPASANFHRIVWRDVSRPSQKRRLIATIIPPGYVTGNSLGVLHLKNTNKTHSLAAILGIMSSLVFEFQLKALLATAHVSAGVMRKVRIPRWEPSLVKDIAKLATECLKGRNGAESRMEVYIARAYGLNRNQFEEILSAFPKLSHSERDILLSQDLWQK